MFNSNRTLPSHTDDELSISAPLAISQAQSLRKSRLINPDPQPRPPILAPLNRSGPTTPAARPFVLATAVWLLLGAGLGAQLLGLGTSVAVPNELAATDEIVTSVSADDPELGLSRDDAIVEEDPRSAPSGDTGAGAQSRFSLAWSQWQRAEYALSGTVVRERASGQITSIPYRAARQGVNSLVQLGTSAEVTSADGYQACQHDNKGVIVCTQPQAVTEEGDSSRAVASLVDGSDPAYRATPLSECPAELCSDEAKALLPALAEAECWQLSITQSATTVDQRWGPSSVFCFDPTSEAMVARRTVLANRIENFVASEVHDQVTNPDQLRPN